MTKYNLAVYTLLLGLTLVSGCSPDGEKQASTNAKDVTEASVKSEPEKPKKEDVRAEALTNPDWIKVDNLPSKWGGLYVDACLMAGPEDSRFFEYRDAETGTEYYFNYIVFPKNTGHAPQAKVIILNYAVW